MPHLLRVTRSSGNPVEMQARLPSPVHHTVGNAQQHMPCVQNVDAGSGTPKRNRTPLQQIIGYAFIRNTRTCEHLGSVQHNGVLFGDRDLVCRRDFDKPLRMANLFTT